MPKRTRKIYLDYAAGTPVDKEVLKTMMPFFSNEFGNPSALYKSGVVAHKAISEARKKIAEILHAQPDTIIFTGGGTESDNLAIFGVTHANTDRPHIISTPIEHDAVLKPLEHLKTEGYEITYVPVDKNGAVNPDDVISAIRPETVLISTMYANNEIGTIEPIAEIGRQLIRYRKEKGTAYPYFHTDACQAAGYLHLDVEKLHVDLMTLNGSKIYGPKGIGLLYVRRGVAFDPQTLGGSQERGRRAGTENVPGIIGFAKALEKIQNTKDKLQKQIFKLNEYFWKELRKNIPGAKLNGAALGMKRLPNNLNIVFPGFSGETLLLYLDALGVSCSTASACNTESVDTSHVLKAIGVSAEDAGSSLRFTLGKGTTKKELDYTASALAKILKLLKK